MNLILITACPSGMATTFLAAKRLEQAATRLGWNVHVEMHGEIAPLQAASAEQIAASHGLDLLRVCEWRLAVRLVRVRRTVGLEI